MAIKDVKIMCLYDALIDPIELKDNPKNRNKHGQDQIERLAEIYKYQGIRHPIIVSKLTGFIVAGHGRKLAAIRAGVDQMPVVYQDFENFDQEYAFVQSDNAVALWADLDIDSIKKDLEYLNDSFNIDMLGIHNFTLDMAEKDFLADADEVPEHVEPKSKLGDIYKLGDHRLMCGDSTSLSDVEKLMDGQKADMVFTSPPYNADTKVGDGDIFNSKKSKKLYAEGYADKLDSESYVQFAKDVLEMCFMFTEGFIFWNVSYNANSRFEYISQVSNRLPFLIEQICWKKSSTIPFKGSMMRDWEPVYLFSTEKTSLGLSEVVSNYWPVSNTNSQQKTHKACFPVELPEKAISLVKKKTGIVFEPFGGSGSTLIACEKTNRKCFIMELDPHYVDVIIARWENFTGKKAELING